MNKTLLPAALALLLAFPAGRPVRADSAPASAPGAALRPYDETADAQSAVNAALAAARRDRKRVLLDFGANWCPDCRALSFFFADPSVKPFLDAHFHVVLVDTGRKDRNLELLKRYGMPIDKGIPAVVVLDRKGRVVASTADGSLSTARDSSPEKILPLLRAWAVAKPIAAK